MTKKTTTSNILFRLAVATLLILVVFTGSYLITSRRAQPRAAENGPIENQSGSGSPAAANPLAWPASGASTPMHENAELSPATAAHIQKLESELKADPNGLEAHAKLAQAYLDSDQFIDAYRQAEALLQLETDHAEGLYVLAAVRMRMGQTQAALQNLERLLEIDPSHVEGLMAYGLVQLRLGASGNAISAWEKGLMAANGQHPELQRLLAVSRGALAEKGDSAEKTPSPWQTTDEQVSSSTAQTTAIHPDWLSAATTDSGQEAPPSR